MKHKRLKTSTKYHSDLLDLREAAELCGCSVQTLRRRIWDGKFKIYKPFKKILLSKEDLIKYLNKAS